MTQVQTNNPVVDALTSPSTKAPESKTPEVKGLDMGATYTQTVNGQPVTKTVAEWMADANKGLGADAKLQQAADAQKVAAAFDTVNNPQADPAKVKEAQAFLYRRAGLSEAQIAQAMTDDTPTNPNQPNPLEGRLKALEAKVDHTTNMQGQTFEQHLQSEVEAAITREPQLSVYLQATEGRAAPAGRRNMLAQVLTQRATDLMRQRRSAGEAFSPAWIADAVSKSVAQTREYAEQVIGAPSALGGRASETMLGANAAELLSQDHKAPASASKADVKKWITGSLLQAALRGPETQTSRV